MRIIRPGRADADSLIKNPYWDISYMPGCCGASVIRRLGAEYINPSTVDYSTCASYGYAPRVSNFRNCVQGQWNHPSNFAPVSLDMAFTACLQDLREEQGRRALLWFAADNMVRRGDVHLGPFSTRGFVAWLKENDLAEVVTSARAGRNEGYIFILNRPQCTAKVRAGVIAYRKIRRECITEPQESVLSRRHCASGWAEPVTNHCVEDI